MNDFSPSWRRFGEAGKGFCRVSSNTLKYWFYWNNTLLCKQSKAMCLIVPSASSSYSWWWSLHLPTNQCLTTILASCSNNHNLRGSIKFSSIQAIIFDLGDLWTMCRLRRHIPPSLLWSCFSSAANILCWGLPPPPPSLPTKQQPQFHLWKSNWHQCCNAGTSIAIPRYCNK